MAPAPLGGGEGHRERGHLCPWCLRELRSTARAGTGSGTALGWAGTAPEPARAREDPTKLPELRKKLLRD